MAVPIDAVAVVDRVQQVSLFAERAPQSLQSDDSAVGYGVSIAGHVIIALLLMFGVFERIELFPAIVIPIEVVMEKPPQAARQDAASSSSAVSALSEPNRPSGIPAVADDDKRAKAPAAALNRNGIDQPKQPGNDGQDSSKDQAGIPLPPAPDGELASGGASAPSQTLVVAPLGPAPPQTTAREPGEDELTAMREQKVECGVLAKRPMPATGTREQARVRGVATEAQALAMIRSTQAMADRHINPNYIGYQRAFVESLDGARKFIVLLPSGFSVNVGDVIQYDRSHLDPSDSCQYIPNFAVRKL
jgi:hypothetical protein